MYGYLGMHGQGATRTLAQARDHPTEDLRRHDSKIQTVSGTHDKHMTQIKEWNQENCLFEHGATGNIGPHAHLQAWALS